MRHIPSLSSYFSFFFFFYKQSNICVKIIYVETKLKAKKVVEIIIRVLSNTLQGFNSLVKANGEILDILPFMC